LPDTYVKPILNGSDYMLISTLYIWVNKNQTILSIANKVNVQWNMNKTGGIVKSSYTYCPDCKGIVYIF